MVEENIMMKYGFFIGSANLPLSEELKMKQKNKKHQVGREQVKGRLAAPRKH